MKQVRVRFFEGLEMKFLKVTLPLVIVTASLLFVGVEGLAAIRAMADLNEKKRSLVQNYSVVSSDRVWNLDRSRITLSLENLLEDDIVVGAYVVDDLGDVIASTGLSLDDGDFTSATADIFFETDSSREFIGRATIIVTSQPVIDQFLNQLLKDGGLAFIILFATVTGSIYANRKTVSVPLGRMMTVIERAEGNDLPEPVDWNSNDEIGVVVQSFNRLIARKKNAEREKNVMEGELREAQKLEAVGQLAGGIAHEINTPAQYIGDNLKFLSESHKDLFSLVEKSMALIEAAGKESSLSSLAGSIKTLSDDIDLAYLRVEIPAATVQSLDGIKQISRIVLAMKEFSHPGTREMSLADINKALENTIVVSRNEWKHVAEMTTAFDEFLPAISCLAGEINQVFLNLIVNAAHAIADVENRQGLGQIGVSTETNGEEVIIRVTDNGSGIPQNARDKIFNPFFTTKEVGKGTGQGLSIARDIVVNKHGGTISFETVESRGTTFTVTLPIHAVQSDKTVLHGDSGNDLRTESPDLILGRSGR